MLTEKIDKDAAIDFSRGNPNRLQLPVEAPAAGPICFSSKTPTEHICEYLES